MGLSIALEIFIFLASSALGLFLILRPARVIELQQWFYLKINWRVQPVNMALEIRNTRMMGSLVIGVVAVFVVVKLLT